MILSEHSNTTKAVWTQRSGVGDWKNQAEILHISETDLLSIDFN